jgi:4-coumarate--CoA ligase
MLLLIFSWLLRSIFAIPRLLLAQRNNGQAPVDPASRNAQIDGGPVEKTLSVFTHTERGLKRNPDGPAVISMFQPADSLKDLVPLVEGRNEWLTLTYTQLHRAAVRLAMGLLAHGTQPNSTMVMLIPNGGEYTVLLWTCVLLRFAYVSLDPAMLEASEFPTLKKLIRTLKPQLIVAPDRIQGKALDFAIAELQLAQPIRISLSQSDGPSEWKCLADWATGAEKSPIEEASLIAAARYDDPERIHSILFTSGTSGLPKGCPRPVRGMSHLLQSQSWLIDAKVGALAVQQAHNSRGIAPAQTLQTWRAGGAVVLTGQSFSVRDAASAIRQIGATFLVLTPPMVHEMATELAERPLDVRSVRRIQVGGDTITRGLLTKCAAMFPHAQICVNHGMTEGGGAFRWPFFDTPVSQLPYFGVMCPVGTIAPGAVMRVWDTIRQSVASTGQLGELHLACASHIRHYLGGRSEEDFYHDGTRRWFKTGDIARIDADGRVFILGREKDMIQRARVTIMPAALENLVEDFAGVQVCFNVG